MLLNFFKQHPQLTADRRNTNLGVILLEFLELYGIKFNYNNFGIRISDEEGREKGFILKKKLACLARNECSQARLAIEDPTNKSNNTARNSYLFEKIRISFRNSYFYLISRCGLKELDDFEDKQVEKSILSNLVGYSAKELELRRKVMAFYESELNNDAVKKKSSRLESIGDYIRLLPDLYDE